MAAAEHVSGSRFRRGERIIVIANLIAGALAKLRPNGRELHRLVRMETDPAHAHRFEELTPGPVLAVAGLVLVGICGVVSAPFRLLRRER